MSKQADAASALLDLIQGEYTCTPFEASCEVMAKITDAAPIDVKRLHLSEARLHHLQAISLRTIEWRMALGEEGDPESPQVILSRDLWIQLEGLLGQMSDVLLEQGRAVAPA